mmetsp:Transcript_11443/g.19023  ORF Transcript_11443/g.19023 Transcript_11443/m.19023 type:complete len:398 (-) Transcript_11443:125-1318(-)
MQNKNSSFTSATSQESNPTLTLGSPNVHPEPANDATKSSVKQQQHVRTRGPSSCPPGHVICCVVFAAAIIAIIIWAIFTSDGIDDGGSRGGGGGFLRGGGGGGRGGGGGGSCFPAGELVLLADLSSKVPIDQLQAGSVIHDGGRVTAVMKLALNREEDTLYRYDDSVFVTGSHLVEEYGTMLPVGESDLAVPTEATPPFVYNLISSNHKVVINSTTFADWEEWEDCEQTWALEHKVLRRLNDGRVDHSVPTNLPADEAVGEGAFQTGTPILLHDGSSVQIQDVTPGDQLYSGDDDNTKNRVFAVMQLWIPAETMIYSYKNLTVTEWTIVLDEEDGLWRNVKYSANATVLGRQADTSGTSTWYQLWTADHTIRVVETGTLFADYHVIDENDPIFFEEL